jgi:radical SAM protein with 4Fe4S-binding SPASM domain
MSRSLALGVGLTNACDLSCAHCYRPVGEDRLDPEAVLRAVDVTPVRSVSFGTGENGLHPGFEALVRSLADRGIPVTMTTNGRSTRVLPDETLARFADVEFSIDYPSRAAHDASRSPGNWDLIEREMARCRGLGVPIAIATVLMAPNHRAVPALAAIAKARGALLRVVVYQPVQNDRFTLSYEAFWEAWREVVEVADVVACGEPIVRAMLGIEGTPDAGCGRDAVRVTPRGTVVPCVYGADGDLAVRDLARLGAGVLDRPEFRRLRTVPDACVSCAFVESCGGGCASRRLLAGGLDRPDPYCPVVRGEGETKRLGGRLRTSSRSHAKASSSCTTILSPR